MYINSLPISKNGHGDMTIFMHYVTNLFNFSLVIVPVVQTPRNPHTSPTQPITPRNDSVPTTNEMSEYTTILVVLTNEERLIKSTDDTSTTRGIEGPLNEPSRPPTGTTGDELVKPTDDKNTRGLIFYYLNIFL